MVFRFSAFHWFTKHCVLRSVMNTIFNEIPLNTFDKIDCVLARTLYYTIEFNKSNTECSILFIQFASHITGSYSTGSSLDLPTQVTINTIYCIAGNFRAVQKFASFADQSRSAKIKTTKNVCNAHAQRQGWIYLTYRGNWIKNGSLPLLLISNRQSSRP